MNSQNTDRKEQGVFHLLPPSSISVLFLTPPSTTSLPSYLILLPSFRPPPPFSVLLLPPPSSLPSAVVVLAAPAVFTLSRLPLTDRWRPLGKVQGEGMFNAWSDLWLLSQDKHSPVSGQPAGSRPGAVTERERGVWTGGAAVQILAADLKTGRRK